MDAADWDLHAVVRSCAAATSSHPRFSTTATISVSGHQDWNKFSITSFQDPFSPRTETCAEASADLHDIYKPFYPNTRQQQRNHITGLSPQSLPISPLSVLNGLPDLSCDQQHQRKQMNQTQHIVFEQLPPPKQHSSLSVANGSKASPRCKKRKMSLKKVCHVPVEQLSSDSWSWRKYGQKPIKGSPYPRGYYKCSTSKSCPARKQVERDRLDPAMFIVTYSSEHNHAVPAHRSSLAGTSRSTATTASSSMGGDIPSPASSTSEKFEVECHNHELIEAENEGDALVSASDVPLDDDFFAGLEDLTG